MTIILIDTDILIDVTRKVPQAIERIAMEAQNAKPAISSVTRKELLIGCRNKDEFNKMLKFLMRFKLKYITPAIDMIADELLETYSLSHSLMIPDALIAATALEYSCCLLSKNQKDFRFIENLKLLPYADKE